MFEIAEKLIDYALGGARLVTTSLPRAGRVTVTTTPLSEFRAASIFSRMLWGGARGRLRSARAEETGVTHQPLQPLPRPTYS